MSSISLRLLLPLLACGILFLQNAALPAENQPSEEKTAGSEVSAGVTDAERTEAREIFAAQCGWCHADFGMKAGKAPQLAGTQMTEQEIQSRIRNGKPGYMPPFRKTLDDQQITLMARYIKSLKPDQ